MSNMPPNLTLRSVLEMLWRQRLVIQIAIIVAVLCAIIYMHVTPRRYAVSMQLVPAPATADRGNSLGGALGALASVGLGGGAAGNQTYKIYLAGLQSHAVSEILSKNEPLMHRMYAAQWSEHDHAWRPSYGPFHYVTWPIKSVLGLDMTPWSPPAAEDVYQFLQSSISIAESKDTPIVTVSMEAADPKFAADFLRTLTDAVDQMMRTRALKRANNYAAYLNEELKHVENSELRMTLIEHLSDQEKQKMMASAAGVRYVADVYSGPAWAPKPTKPSLPSALIGSLVIWLGLGFLVALRLDHKGIAYTFNGLSFGRRDAGNRHGRYTAVADDDRYTTG